MKCFKCKSEMEDGGDRDAICKKCKSTMFRAEHMEKAISETLEYLDTYCVHGIGAMSVVREQVILKIGKFVGRREVGGQT